LFDIIEDTEIPMDQFALTHLNRDEELFGQVMEFGKMG